MAVIVDSGGNLAGDAGIPAAIGLSDPRLRVVRALPMQATEILRPRAVVALTGNSEAVITTPRIYVHRMVGATRD